MIGLRNAMVERTRELASLADPTDAPALLALLRLLYAVGRADLPLGRLFEGHVDAMQIVSRYGTDPQRRALADVVAAGATLGVWNADLAGESLRLDEHGLSGGKSFASGAGILSHALVTVECNGGRQLLLLDLVRTPPTIDRRFWRVIGMLRSETHVVRWHGATLALDDPIGRPDDYVREPWFSGGALRFAAVQAGGIAKLLDGTRDHLVATGRGDDPHQAGRLAGLYGLAQAAAASVRTAASAWFCDEAARLPLVAAARTAVYEAGGRALAIAQEAVGVQALFVETSTRFPQALDGSRIDFTVTAPVPAQPPDSLEARLLERNCAAAICDLRSVPPALAFRSRAFDLSFSAAAPYRVTGVFEDLPRGTDLKFSMLARQGPGTETWWSHWGSTSLATYLRFDTPAAAKDFEGRMPAFVTRHGTRDMGPRVSSKVALSLLPIADVHLQPEGRASAAKKLTIVTLGIVGALTLLIAIVNYVNLATARAGLRAREVAMRKVLGADQPTLVRHFLGEAVFTVALAAILGLALAELGLPLVNAAGGTSLAIPYALAVPALAVLAILVGTLAGFYPALLLARWPASQVLSSARSPGGGRSGTRVREALVVFQFTLAVAFIVGTMVLVAQTRHIRATDLGFKREGLLVVEGLGDNSLDKAQRMAMLRAFAAIPGVEAVTTANTAVGYMGNNNFNNVDVPGRPKPGPNLRQIDVARGFFHTYGAKLVAGRLFDDAHRADDSTDRKKGDPRTIVINRLAVAKLGFASPQDAIGKTVGGGTQQTIIGVVDQLRFYSPRLPDDPTYYVYYGDIAAYPTVTLRFSGDPRPVVAAAQTAWRRMASRVPFIGDTGVHGLDKFYQDDDRAARLFGIGAALAVLIGCVGLWGLASFNTARRIKEIGIRKTLGASSRDIVRLLVGQFLRPVLLANLFAWPLAWLAMRNWLAGFDDRVALSPLFFIAASALALAIALATVLAQSLRASRATPAWALRHE